MNNPGKHSPVSLAARREALVTQCALQRINAATDIREMMAPVHNLRHKVGGNLAIPASAAGAVIGLLATSRRSKLVPMLTTAFSLWRLGRNALMEYRKHKAATYSGE